MTALMKKVRNMSIEKTCKNLTLFVMLMFTLISSFCAFTTKPSRMGESDNYMLDTIALENRLSLFITESDLEQAKQDFPYQYQDMKNQFPNQFPIKIAGPVYKVHGWYFGTYSFSCIPAKLMLKVLHHNQAYAFVITNEIMYILSLLVVFLKLKTNYKIKFIIMLMLTLNPATFYLTWMSSEIMMFSLVVISLVFFANREHKKAGFFVSLAGTLNPTIMVYGFAIIIDYFIKVIKENKNFNNNRVDFKSLFRCNIKDALLLALCFVPSLVPFIYNYVNFRVFNLSQGMTSFKDYWPRFFSYLFDLNLGILPYFSIVLILCFILLIVGIVRKDIFTYIFALAFLGTIGGYSLIYHINCGMTGIARYNIWSVPIMIFFIATQYEKLIKKTAWKKISYISMIISSVISLGIIIGYGGVFPNKTSDMKMTPIAQYVLDKYPYIYNPYYNTFMIRVAQNTVYGGYKEPVIYLQNEGYVRKILVTPKTTHLLDNLFYNDDKALEDLRKQVENINHKNGYQYINLTSNTKLKIKPEIQYSKFVYTINNDNILNQDLVLGKRMSHNQFVLEENNKLVLKKDGIVFGPYKQLNPGKYTVTIKGDNLDKSIYDAAYSTGSKVIKKEIKKVNQNEIVYTIKVDSKIKDLEIRVFNNQEKEIMVSSITIE